MHVLIVEDEPDVQFILYKALERAGYNCWVVSNGKEAFEIFQIIRFDVVISDWRMPVMNGLELCKKIRELDEAKGFYTYFIFLTAMADRQYCLQGLRAGANDYLYKPIDRYALKLKLQNAAVLLGYTNDLAHENNILTQELRLDPLTRLGNRRKMQEDLKIMRDLVKRYDNSFAVVMFDLDGFKNINDTNGHAAGDQVLIAVAQLLQEQVRQSDWLYRYGGEEFTLIMPEQNQESVRQAVTRILAHLSDLKIPSPDGTEPISVTMSAGVSFMNLLNPDPETVFVHADEALYAAKLAGKNTVVFHEKEKATAED